MTHHARYLVLPPHDCTMAPPPDNLGRVGPYTGCNKKQSASKRSHCTLCQEELVCQSCSWAGICRGVCCTNPSWHLEFQAKTVTDVPSLLGTASFFMLCDQNTYLYLTVLDMPRAVTDVRSPLRWFCHGNSIVSTAFNTVLATVHAPPPPGVGIILRNVPFGGFVVLCAPHPHFSATCGRVLGCTLVPPQTLLLDYVTARWYCWVAPREKQSSRVSKAATPKKGKWAQFGSDESDTEDVVHLTRACQRVHYPKNSPVARDARLLISFVISVLRQPPTTGFKRVPYPATTSHDSPADGPHVRWQTMFCALSSCLSYNRPPIWWPVSRPSPTTVACLGVRHAPLSLHALPFEASLDGLAAMDVTTSVAPRVRCLVAFVGNKDSGQKDVR